MKRVGVSRSVKVRYQCGASARDCRLGRRLVQAFVCLFVCALSGSISPLWAAGLEVGFGRAKITPAIDEDRPVWLAGYFPGRAAEGVHDPLYARCCVLSDGTAKVACVSLDLIGLPLPVVQRIRGQLTGLRQVVIACTHNHEGPDTIGIWGPNVVRSGVDAAYLDQVVETVVRLVRQTASTLTPARARFGTARDERLLADSRLPIVKDPVLRVLVLADPSDGSNLGLLVQWNCHPEALGARNTMITADFPAATIAALQTRYRCPVVYFSGAIGGLLAPPHGVIRNAAGEVLQHGDFAFADQYGRAVAQLAGQAIERAAPIRLTPLRAATCEVGIPVTNRLYRLARLLGIVERDGFLWQGADAPLGEKITRKTRYASSAIKSEVGYLQLGELGVALIPGELYPELVYGQVEDPAAEGVDYPESAVEPSVQELLPVDRWMVWGLANDEIGYIIPRRQWDRRAPFAYGRRTAQYGEINSCGPDVAPAVMQALARCVREVRTAAGDR